ncbi:MAG: hypothetical protein ACREND_03170 [Gemmatimonadaceae bacterium]
MSSSPDQQTWYMLLRRRVSSAPEAHAKWDDVIIVRKGAGALVFGDSLTGAHVEAPGELRGGQLVHPHQLLLHPGDVVRVPAAVPHVFVADSAQPLEYLMIKVRQQRLPIRWFSCPCAH